MFAIKGDCAAHGSQKGNALRELSDDGHMGNAFPVVHPATCYLLISVSFLLSVWALSSSLHLPKQETLRLFYFSPCPVNLYMTRAGHSPSKGFLTGMGYSLYLCLSKGHLSYRKDICHVVICSGRNVLQLLGEVMRIHLFSI